MILTVVMITYNSADVVEGALQSIKGLWDELLVGDGGSTDGTVEMVKKYGATVLSQRAGTALGVRKQELVESAKGPASTRGGSSTRGGDWILVLDADERVGIELRKEIGRLGAGKIGREYKAYKIPYQNYVFGRPVYYGGEKYAKVRLFRHGSAKISPDPLHEEVIVKGGKIGELSGYIHHHSYRTPWQLFAKFTQYAWVATYEKKRKGETLSLKKLFLYGPHMFWARFVKDNGYKDGWRGFVLALAFGYMEGLTYWLRIIRNYIR